MLVALSAERGTAALVAESLVDADLRGIDSHGVHLLDLYCTRIGKGQIDPRGAARVVDDRGSVVHVDGGLGFGQPCGLQGIDVGSSATEHGIVPAIARDHAPGALGYYTPLP